jgi:decaprenylphospho-beta-D-ribofuranose 2-oxidase
VTVFPTAEKEYISFDGTTRARSHLRRPDRYRFFDRRNFSEPTISRGAGLSYVAASFDRGVVSVEHRRFNRVLGFDARRKVIKVEAGISLGELYVFLARRRLFLPVQPGHPNITVGGCIATDAHGKGHTRYGTFSRQILALTLFHPRHGEIRLTPHCHAELFDLTCGGFGLTGAILDAELNTEDLRPFESCVYSIPCLSQLPDALESAEKQWDFVYSWHDLMCTRARFGRGYIQCARLSLPVAEDVGLSEEIPANSSLSAARRGRWCPSLYGRTTARLINGLHARRLAAAENDGVKVMTPFEFQFPIRGLELYFHLFGRRGFLEYQALIPTSAFASWAEALRKRLGTSRPTLTLGSAKLFRDSARFLRFTGEGICFALNVARSPDGVRLFEFLDDLGRDVGAKPNLVKDSRLSRDVVARAYPEYELFRSARRDFDPDCQFRSGLSRRLAL